MGEGVSSSESFCEGTPSPIWVCWKTFKPSPARAQRQAPRSRLVLIPHPQGPQPQRVEADESLRVLLVIRALVVLERHQGRRIQRLVARPPGHDDVALVEIERHLALDMLLALVD